MPELQFYNTLTRKKEKFTPIDAGNVRLYACGPTVYDYAHIGNARPLIVFDVLYRLLRARYGKSHVRYVRNITDVDDKINARAARDYPDLPLNSAIARLTEQTERQFHEDAAALSCLPPNAEPRATENIEKMKQLIERLLESGHAYVAENHVLFSVAAMNESAHKPHKTGGKGAPRNPPYGNLSRRTREEMLAGARVDVADYKRGSQDFVLWKPAKAGEPGWESPAGIAVLGRPGWHIECSAMSMAQLLEPYGGGLACDDPLKNCFDIHGGGLDLIFPHHENEIAQSACALGAPRMANFWLHNGFLQVEGQKMSKSLGNFITIRQIVTAQLPEFQCAAGLSHAEQAQWAGFSARFSMLQTHYREPLNWTQKRFEEASAELYRWYELLCRHAKDMDLAEPGAAPDALSAALADDLNTPKAIALLRQFYKQGHYKELAASMEMLGLLLPSFLRPPYPLFAGEAQLSREHIETMLERRLRAIAAKDWSAADRLRADLESKGVKLMDREDESGRRVTDYKIGIAVYKFINSVDKETGAEKLQWESV